MNVRLAAVRAAMRVRGLDALVVTVLPNIRYLCGFSGSNALFVVTRRGALFLSDSRYALQSRQEVHGCRRVISNRGLADGVVSSGLVRTWKRVGFESHAVTHAQYLNYRRLFRHTRLVPTTGIVEEIASRKDAVELTSIRKAAMITDRVFQEVIGMIRPGITEREVAAQVSYLHRCHGADGDAFETIVAAGEHSALPHARPGGRVIRRGDLVTLDMGCVVNGYHSDMTRTVAIGRVSRQARAMYRVVAEAQAAAVAFAQAGMPARDLDTAARSRIAAGGYGRYFTHSLGHGVGLQIHEQPRVAAGSTDQLETGNVITIEPGVYVRGVGGVRIEDMVALTATGCTVLTQSPRDLLIL